MAALNFKPSDVTSDVIPKGEYRLVISGEELKDTKAGDGKRLNLKLTVVGGQYQNRTFFEGLNIVNKNATAQRISEQLLKKICEAIGIASLTDTAQLLNGSGGQISKPFLAYVDVRETDDGLQNVLKKPRAIGNAAAAVPPTTLASDVPPVVGQDAPEVSAPWATGA